MTQFHHLYLVLSGMRARMRDDERGATAVEWVIITAALIGLAVGVGAIIIGRVTDAASDIEIP